MQVAEAPSQGGAFLFKTAQRAFCKSGAVEHTNLTLSWPSKKVGYARVDPIVLVDVFLARHAEWPATEYLVVESRGALATSNVDTGRWRFYGTLDSESELFDGLAVELHLQAKGFLVIRPQPITVWS
jgi:hypothetical protein